MYDDDKSWTQHYNDWVKIIKLIPETTEPFIFRRKIIQGLIDDYKRNFIKDK